MNSSNLQRLKQKVVNWLVNQTTAESGKPLRLNVLEERVLYSAAPLPLELMNNVETVDVHDVFESVDIHLDEIASGFEHLLADEHDLSLIDLTSLSIQGAAPRSEIVFVDRSVDDYQQLVDDILNHNDSNVVTQIAYLDSGGDGVSQITERLQHESAAGLRLDAIHLISHGNDGELSLGNLLLNHETVEAHRDQIASWQNALTPDADLLIYGCDVAATEHGQSFVNLLSDLSAADVAASTDITGHQSLGGDWDFEYQLGTIESQALLTVEVRSSWQHELGVADASDADGSASRAVAASNSGHFVGVYSSDVVAGSVGKDIYYELQTQQDMIDGNLPTPIRVNDTVIGDQQWATVAMADNGDMTFVWTSNHSGSLGVYGKIIDADGNVIKSEFQIDQGNGGNNASIAMDKQGTFVVVWESTGDGDPLGDVYGQLFDKFGATIDSTFQINTGEANGGNTSGYQGHADVAMSENNEFIVSWDNYYDNDTESRIFANKFQFDNSTVTSMTGEFSVTPFTPTQLLFGSSVDINNNGDFVVAWTSDGTQTLKSFGFGIGEFATDIATSIHARTFQSDGTLEHSIFGINTTHSGTQENASVALLEDNVVVFVWQGESDLSSDSEGVYQRQFHFDGTPIDSQEQFVSPLADTGIQENVTITKYDNDEFAIGFSGELNGADGYHIVASSVSPTVASSNTPSLVYSTSGNGSMNSTSWDGGDAISFGGGSLTFGSPSDGSANILFDSALDLDAIHFVTQPVTIDTSTPTVLKAGDILFSIGETDTTSIPGLGTVYDHDIILFQPVAPGNYDFSSGTFSVVASLSGVDDIWGLTVVERNTRIGDYDVNAGDILFTSSLPLANDIKLLRIAGGIPTIEVLIDGDDVGLDLPIKGLDLIEQQTTVGGLTLNAGTLLLSTEGNETVGVAGGSDIAQQSAGGLQVQDNDIYALEFSTTTLGGGTAAATPIMFFDASTVSGLAGGGNGDVDAISLITAAAPADAEQSLDINRVLSVDEGSTISITNAHLLTLDVDNAAGDLIYSVTDLPSHGTILLSGSPVSSFTQQDINSGLVFYQHDGTETTLDSFAFSVDDGQGQDSTGTFNISINPVNDAPTNLSSGVQLNGNGGNDAYLQAGAGDLMAGLDQFTIELKFSSQFSNMTPLVSYETAAGDDLEIRLVGDGSLRIAFNNTSLGSLTGIDYDTLMNGSIVDFAFSWDNTNGDWAVMVDGMVTDRGSGLAIGQTLAAGGELIFGQDQDSVGGGFEFDENFSGTFHDIRIWDEVRSPHEIAANQNHKFDSNNVPSGLVANWQMTELVGGTTIVDLVNPGANDLTLGHASGVNFVESTPSDSLHVDENAANGTVIGHIIPTDAEYSNDVVSDGSFLAFEVTDPNYTSFFADGSGPGSQFGPWTVVQNVVDVRGTDWESSPLGGRVVDLTGGTPLGPHGLGVIQQNLTTVVGQQYVVTFAMTGNFEGTETQQRLSVNVGGSSNEFSFDEPAGWSRTNLQWAEQTLTFTATSTTTVLQFQALTGTYRGAMIGDVQVAEVGTAGDGIFSFGLTDNAGGRFAIDSTTGEITVADQTRLDFETDTAHTITVEVTDPAGGTYVQDLVIQVNDVNESPTLPVNSGMTVVNGSAGTVISSTMLNADDVDDSPADLTYTITSDVTNGSLWLSGVQLTLGDSFSQQDINDGNLRYDHNGAMAADSFDFVLADGGEDGAAPVSDTFNINPTNFEQVIITNAGLTLDEGTSAGVSSAVLETYDSDTLPSQIVYTITSGPINGTLLVAGVPASSFSQADINAGNVTYDHDGSETLSDTIRFSVDDGLGLATLDSLAITVNPVNDDPIVATNSGISVSEGGTSIISRSQLLTSDVDNGPGDLEFTITNPADHGTILVNGVAASSFTQSDIDNNRVAYQHDGSETTSDIMSLTVNDAVGGVASASVAFSITPVNDSPVVLVNTGMTALEGSTATIKTAMLFTKDVDDYGRQLTYTIDSNVIHGTLFRGATQILAGDTFTQADINHGLITYDHDGSETSNDRFLFTVADGGEDGAVSRSGSFTITITPVNDAPALDFTLTNTLSDVVRNETDPPGDTVASIIASAGNQITDDDLSSVEGIAVVGVDDTNGLWQYSTDNGSTWKSFFSEGVANGAVNESSAVVLDENAKIRFVPNPGYYGDAGEITFKAWDQTDKLASGTTHVDATHTDNTSPFSAVTDTATLDVLHANLPPAAYNDDLGIVSNLGPTTINIADLLANDADPDGGLPQLIDFTQPTHGTLVDNGDGTLTYTPDNGFSGTDEFQYTIDDGQDGLLHYWSFSNGAIDSVGNGNGINHGAQTTEGSVGDAMVFDKTLMEYIELPDVTYTDDFTLSFDFKIDDNDGNGFRYIYSHDSLNKLNSLNIFFREANNGGGAPNTLATIIRSSQDPSIFNDLDIDASALIGNWHTYTLVVEKGVGAAVFIDGVQQASTTRGDDSINPAGNVFIGARNNLNANAFFDGSLDTFRIHDRAMTDAEVGELASSNSLQTATVRLTVNTPPTASPEAFSTNSVTPISDTVAGNDGDLDSHTLTYSLVSGPTSGTFNLNPDGSFTYTPTANQSSTESIVYQVSDPFGAQDTATITIDVNAVPAANDDVVQINVGESVNIKVVTNDSDAENQLDPGSIQVVGGGPSHGTISLTSAGEIVYMHDGSNNLTDSFQYTVKDIAGNASNVANVHLTINQGPTNIALSNDQIDENASDGSYVGTISADDPEGDNVTFLLADDAQNRFDIDPTSGAITIETGALINFEDSPSHEISVVVTDQHGVATVKPFTITVNDINEAPEVTGINRTVYQGMAIAGDVSTSATDPESDTLTFKLAGQPSHGTVTMNSEGLWEYQHDDSENFVDQFAFIVADTAGNQTISHVNIGVIPVKNPIANPDTFATSSVTQLSIGRSQLLANDENVGPGTLIEITQSPQNGTVSVKAGGNVVYTPNVSFEGTDTFAYRVINPPGKFSQPAAVAIHVDNPGITPTSLIEIIDDSGQQDDTVQDETEPPDSSTEVAPDGPVVGSSEDSNADVLPSRANSTVHGNFADDFENEENDIFTGGRSNVYRLPSSRYVYQPAADLIEFDGSSFQLVSTGITGELSDAAASLAVNFWQDLDATKSSFEHSLGIDSTSFAAATSSMLTVGYLVWMVRAGALLSTFVSSMPAWQTFDPLPVIESGIDRKFSDDEDTLESIVDNE